ncbi:MAG: lipocalin family protein [Azospirillaceae bacterium]|nr:lipocalin family protein [Azospirillaceae bacterium]
MPNPFRIAVLVGLLTSVSGCASSPGPQTNPGALTAIETLDLPRYLGTWYEIAKYPNRFQRNCAGGTSATYSLEPDGAVKVVNRCRLANGDMDQAVGAARQSGGPTSARLEVRFAPWWLGWLPTVWGDYWVIDIDPGYQLAAVSEPRRAYLWILSRTPTVDPVAYQALLGRLQGKGYDLGKLEVSKP